MDRSEIREDAARALAGRWLPISTAAKTGAGYSGDDGPRVLGWDGHHVAVTSWNATFKEWRDESEATDSWGIPHHGSWEPTHWMPLPEPPAK